VAIWCVFCVGRKVFGQICIPQNVVKMATNLTIPDKIREFNSTKKP
jgi:hypothetical protein